MAAGWELPVGVCLFIASGIALAVQAGVNASLGVHTSKAFAAVVSFAMGTLISLLYMLVDATAISKAPPVTAAALRGAPWWSWLGGALGALYVLVNIVFAYRLGSGTAVSIFVCAQLVTSIVLDLTGLVGFQQRAFSWPRITGATLMFIGVVLVTQFPGQPITAPAELPQQQHQQQPQQPVPPADKAGAAGGDASSSSSTSSLPSHDSSGGVRRLRHDGGNADQAAGARAGRRVLSLEQQQHRQRKPADAEVVMV